MERWTPAATWQTTTHDWSRTLDVAHLELIRGAPEAFAPGGTVHLVLEVIAYAAEEAEWRGAGRGAVTLHRDGSVAVTDDGRGTDTRIDDRGEAVRKPIMTTKDVRIFDHPHLASLPDGHPRRGMSVVAALSSWLVHTSRRRSGSWAQRYEHGIPVTGLTPMPGDGTTGTTVHFTPDGLLLPETSIPVAELRRLAGAFGPNWRTTVLITRRLRAASAVLTMPVNGLKYA